MWRRALVSFLGAGYLPVAGGTWGSFFATGLFVLLWLAAGTRGWLLTVLIVGVIAAASVINVSLGGWIVAHYGSPDPNPVCIDEVAGQLVTVLFVPVTQRNLVAVALCMFFLFRFFDIVKLPPARQAERLPAGLGILCDDLVAGIQANLVMQLIFRVFVGG